MSALSGIEIYDGRMSYAWCKLSESHFDHYNHRNELTVLGGGCLDAPDHLPGGSVRDYGRTVRFVRQSLVARSEAIHAKDVELDALADKLIAELLLELENERAR